MLSACMLQSCDSGCTCSCGTSCTTEWCKRWFRCMKETSNAGMCSSHVEAELLQACVLVATE
eukprot:CAMPEP_0177284954 /NCGR_PEP_ID=MMETSP0367-20130122/72806_1 /TAXON_ID=447022 ORGANISM="Scrippsiella hangoei-like, Strain SHHI-4" /NCGR_SAMPLE_ID=MMETSP0367 /ASSEMBLY_ACC=CAM_ASM_000362 /LENGTH=61 /DNA_ID=CAMNT_0018742051 /DNA_START=92 /DNA_END=274 /DNA_ORIENTATION=+